MELIEYFNSGMTFDAYVDMTQSLLEQGKTTGPNQSQMMVDYTRLNQQRTKRWIKKGAAEINNALVKRVSETPQKWLVISEPWCGDAAHALPFFQKIAALLEIEMRIVLRDENEALMAQFLTNGGKSIPKLIAFSGTNDLIFHWGPRPKELQNWFVEAKKEGVKYEEIFDYLQNFYNKNKGSSTIKEIESLLSKSLDKE